MRRFILAEVPAAPWKNQGGTTRALLSLPAGSDLDTFAWRVSVATVNTDGPFSTFPGVERTIMLLNGDGIELSGTHVRHRLDTRAAPFTFSGNDRLTCSLIGEPSLVLNAMARRGRGRARFDLCTAPTTVNSSNGLLLSVSGDWQHGGELISAGHGLWWTNSPHPRFVEPTGPSGQLAVLEWHPA